MAPFLIIWLHPLDLAPSPDKYLIIQKKPTSRTRRALETIALTTFLRRFRWCKKTCFDLEDFEKLFFIMAHFLAKLWHILPNPSLKGPF